MRRVFAIAIQLTMLVLFQPPVDVRGQDAKKIHEVKPEKFVVQIELSGVFAAERTAEISLEPKSWSQYEDSRAVLVRAPVVQCALHLLLGRHAVRIRGLFGGRRGGAGGARGPRARDVSALGRAPAATRQTRRPTRRGATPTEKLSTAATSGRRGPSRS